MSLSKDKAACGSLILEQAVANALAAFFAGTPYGHFYRAQNGSAPVQYLQMIAQTVTGNAIP